jgi:RimJ/RimL family protein N-acetyltransferase
MNINDNLFVGKRVRLAAPKPQDHETIANWSNNTEYLRMLDYDPARPYSTEFVVNLDKEQNEDKRIFPFRIRTLADDKLIGVLDVEVAWVHQACWLAIGIGERDFWGQGYGAEAFDLGMTYAFRELNIMKLTLGAFEYNTRAISMYEKAGLTHEGRLRSVVVRDGQRYDILHMGILRSEWAARRQAADHAG